MRAVDQNPKLELCVVVGASAMLRRFGRVHDIIVADGFEPMATVYSIVEGETPTTMAKSTGLAITELATTFENLKPDIVLTVADRFETIATAIAGSYMNIPVAHTQGGEITGSIDESVRHAVTKLSHIHFPSTKDAAKNLLQMGEDPSAVHCTGCPAMDILTEIDLDLFPGIFSVERGVGPPIDLNKPYLVVLQHPVTTEYGHGLAQIGETIKAVENIGLQTVWLWPNVDAGSDEISKGLRMYREKNPTTPAHFYRNFTVDDYARVINGAACLVGNSSSAIREGAFLGVPAVDIGTRQQGRERDRNVVHANYDANEIEAAVRSQMLHGKYAPSNRFGDGAAGARIANHLADAEFTLQKQFFRV